LWLVSTGEEAIWRIKPQRQTGRVLNKPFGWRQLKLWEQQDVWLDAWRAFLAQLDAKGQLDWSEAFVDGSFAPAKKGANASAQPKGAKARSGWWWSTAKVFLWQTTRTLRPPRKSSCSKKR